MVATPYNTYAAARLISTAAPVRHFMRTKELLKFSVNTPIEDAKKVMASVRHRYFPILDENGKIDVTKIADANDFGDWEEQGCKG